ncbi:MAG: cupin domain-containing protein [Burkholderiales bacterium]|nr:cupin domain-containing protein [Phycisphaerae bacterium]
MDNHSNSASQQSQALPPDDLRRQFSVARPDADQTLRHVAVVGDVYTILLSGRDTAGRYALIDMFVPPDGGPPPHRHDFEEMYHVLEGEVEVMFRGVKSIAHSGETVNFPANAPHAFKNVSQRPARLLCMVSPPGAEDFFLELGDPVASRTGPLPDLDKAALAERASKGKALAAKYKNEIIAP